MTETELDELLDLWNAPQPAESWRVNVRHQLSAAQPRRLPKPVSTGWRIPFKPLAGIAAGAAVAAILCVVLIAQAYPQLLTSHGDWKIPFLAEAKYVSYGVNALPVDQMLVHSYSYLAQEIIVDEESPGLLGVVRATMAALRYRAFRLGFAPFNHSPEFARSVDLFVGSGCASAGSVVLGHETILGYRTTVVENRLPLGRFTTWYAPDLGCYRLKAKSEIRNADGSFRLEQTKETLKVIMGCRAREVSGTCISWYSKYPFN